MENTSKDSASGQDPSQSSKEKKTESEKSDFISEQLQTDTKRAVIGGSLAAVITAIGGWLVGEATGGEGHVLLNMTLETTRSFCATVTLALGNILALMLTLLSLSANSNVDLTWSHYQRVKKIAWLVSVVLIGSILIYLLLNIPLEKTEQSGTPSFEYLYYMTLATGSVLGGALISVVLMLYSTVIDIINAVGPDEGVQADIQKASEAE